MGHPFEDAPFPMKLIAFSRIIHYNSAIGVIIMDQKMLQVAFQVGRFFCSDIYAFYQDTYKGTLGKVQVEALDYIHLKKQVNVKELSSRLNISMQHASKIAAKLEELGYAEKTRDPADGRACLYSLTDSGIHFIEDHINQSNQHLEEIVDRLSQNDQDRLLSSLTQLAAVLEHVENAGLV